MALSGRSTYTGLEIYRYDAFNRLTGVSGKASYTYNANNLRASKTVNREKTNFVWNGQNLAAEHKGDKTNTYTYDANGNSLSVDGVYGNNTKYAVKQFQKNNGLSADGVVGPVTMAATRKNFKPRKDTKKGNTDRQPTGSRERNVGHPNGEEHSRVPKGNGNRNQNNVHRAETAEKVLAGLAGAAALAGTVVTALENLGSYMQAIPIP